MLNLFKLNALDSKSDHLVLFSECIPVKGYMRSVFYDLSRIDFIFLPNELTDILIKYQGFKKSEIISNNKEQKEVLEQYFSYLNEHDFIFFCDKDEVLLFPPISLVWDFPAQISNIFIEDYLFDKLVCEVPSFLNTKDIVLNINKTINLNKLRCFLDSLSYSKVKSIDIYVNERLNSEIKQTATIILSEYSRIRTLIFYNSNENYCVNGNNGFSNLIVKKENIFNRKFSVQKDYFNINITLFTESQAHHTYFNRKLYIGPNGEIKNAPECEEEFGHIQDLESPEQLKEIVQTPAFQKYWYVHKEICDVCKDCEFRHMCVDNRLPYQRSENEWYHKIECNYNPYIAKWKDEEGYRTLAECGVISNENGFSIDHEKIAKINEELWGEEC